MADDLVARKRALAESAAPWWHSIDLGDGVVTDGHKTAQYLAEELAALRLPPLGGRTVLDVGAWDGYYSFEAERQARREWSPSTGSSGPSTCRGRMRTSRGVPIRA